MSSDQRRQIISERFASGELPTYVQARIFSGRGTGHTCDCCGGVIDAREIEYEIELPDGRTVASHIACWLEWAALSQSSADDPSAAEWLHRGQKRP
ncbi:MAG TPA: hypothetical protein VMG11_14420 [Steroidobacteraceae bacterium]|nr:hypothetical protein [Steroidobacteraceae bacterium]